MAIALVAQGWRVALVGRRTEALQQTAQLTSAPKQCLLCPCDIADLAAVRKMAARVLSEFKEVEVLVNSAAINVPRRLLDVLSLEDYQTMINTNLNGAYYCLQAFLPQMRARRSGAIINIISEAGKQASAKSGPAYVMSKFGLAGLTQSLNVEEKPNGIRACSIFPGDIDTPLLDRRPHPPTAEARKRMLQSADVAECALLAINLPERAVVEEILIRPRS